MDTTIYKKVIDVMQEHQRNAMATHGMIFEMGVSDFIIKVRVQTERAWVARMLYRTAPFSEAQKMVDIINNFIDKQKEYQQRGNNRQLHSRTDRNREVAEGRTR